MDSRKGRHGTSVPYRPRATAERRRPAATGTLPRMTTPRPQPDPTPPGPPPFHRAPTGVPPGWYPGPSGVPQWWDGQGWGPPAPPPADNSSTLGVLAHLGTFVGGFVVPLIIRQTEGKKNRFVKHHATEALNFAITHGIVALLLVGFYVVGIVASVLGTATTRNPAGFGAFFGVVVIVFVVLIAVSITAVVFTVVAAVQAGQRRYWRYPVCIRFVPGAATKAEVDALNRGIV